MKLGNNRLEKLFFLKSVLYNIARRRRRNGTPAVVVGHER
jgi:hypothetical protein